jgi:pSer/pThr/pTyr-binding forkhead associated (FHA) protein
MRIGRRSPSGNRPPEIDLSSAQPSAPEDPGISRTHALLMRSAEGGYTLMDVGSTNGTTLNESDTPIAPNVPIPLADGDRIHLGAWTTLTVRAAGVPAGSDKECPPQVEP